VNDASAPDVQRVLTTIADIRQLLVRSPWLPKLEAIADKLGSKREATEALHELGDLFGGMGSLNDIVFCKENQNVPVGLAPAVANRRMDMLLDELFAQLFPAEAGPPVDSLPNRIRHAFRTGGPGAE
jgi:hypothetical protein